MSAPKSQTFIIAGKPGWPAIVTDKNGDIVTNVIECDTKAGYLIRHASGPDGKTLTDNGEIILERRKGSFTIK